MRFLLWLLLFSPLPADETVVWRGSVYADGVPTQPIDLELDQKYQLKVCGVVNLGKWWQDGRPLGNDAIYEFNSPSGPTELNTFRNSLDIPLLRQPYNPDHIYESIPFTAKQTKIHFWIYDVDYNDNKGAFEIEIKKLSS